MAHSRTCTELLNLLSESGMNKTQVKDVISQAAEFAVGIIVTTDNVVTVLLIQPIHQWFFFPNWDGKLCQKIKHIIRRPFET